MVITCVGNIILLIVYGIILVVVNRIIFTKYYINQILYQKSKPETT